jgi:pimeloyl-ACP methyl ester carboxylesterase
MAARLRWNESYRFADPSAVSQPVLVITGEDGLDRVVSPHLTRRYLSALPDARHAVLPRTGHIGLLTKPAEFAEMVRRFADETHQASSKPTTMTSDTTLPEGLEDVPPRGAGPSEYCC